MSEDVMNADDGTTPVESEGMSIAERAAALDASLVSQPLESKPTEQSRLEKLVQSKYGGDADKLFDSIIENWNSMSSMNKTIREMQGQLESLKPSSTPPIEETDLPELRQSEEQIKSTQEQIQSASSEMQRIGSEYSKASQLVHQLTGKIEIADAMDKPQLLAQLAEAKSRVDNLDSRYVSLQLFSRTAAQNLLILEQRSGDLKRRAREDTERERNGNESVTALQQRAQSDFLSTSEELLNSLGVTDGAKRSSLMTLAHAQIYSMLSSLPPGTPPQDIPALTRKVLMEQARVFGIRSSEFAHSNEKLSTSPARYPTSVSPLTNLDKARAEDPEFWKSRASAVTTSRMNGR